MKLKLSVAGLFLILFAFFTVASQAGDPPKLDLGTLPEGHLLLPNDQTLGTVFLVSDASGWSDEDQKTAELLQSKNMAVFGIDLPSYLKNLIKVEDDCIYLISDIEAVNQQILRAAGSANMTAPIIAGIGDGGAMALAMAAQTPDATIGGYIVVDPTNSIAVPKELCTPAKKTKDGDRTIYGLTDGTLPAPINIWFTPNAPQVGKDHVNDLVASHSDIVVQDASDDARTQLNAALEEAASAEAQNGDELNLPLTILDAQPRFDTLAVIYSGDGGWRDLDKQVGEVLQQQGIPVVGVDALRYFWSEKKPQQVADDLATIIGKYTKKWKVKNVLLVGYSFGADILPKTFSLLSEADRKRVVQMSLLGLAHEADFEIAVTGWLGASGAGAEGDPSTQIAPADLGIVQCVYGTDEDDTACPDLQKQGAETIAIDGGHHFDEDYEALAKKIIASLQKRLAVKK